MRLLHTSDWHLGLNEHNLDRRRDHDYVLGQIRNIAREERVDVILNTGDLFDKKNAGIETLRHAWNILEELADIAPLVVVCGNHDSAKLFELMGAILKNRLPIHFIELSTLRRRESGIIRLPARDGHEQIIIGAVPFIYNANYIQEFVERGAERSAVTYSDNVGAIEHLVGQWMSAGYDQTRDIRVFAAHLLVENAEPSGSEYRFHVDSDFATRPQRIPTAEYVAFGHIHKPQIIPGVPHGRYAGSPLPVDFGERSDQKGVYLVSGRPGYALEIKQIPLDVGRRMVHIQGTLEAIAGSREQWANTIAKVTVEVGAPVTDLEAQVRALLSNTEICSVLPLYPARESGTVQVEHLDSQELTISELFASFVAGRADFGDPDRVKRYFDLLLDHVARGEDEAPSFPDVDEVLQ